MDVAKVCALAGRYLDGEFTAHGPSLGECTADEWRVACEEVTKDRQHEEAAMLETAIPFVRAIIARLDRGTEAVLDFASPFVQRKLLWAARTLDRDADHVFQRRDVLELDEAIRKYRTKKERLDEIAAAPKPKPRRRVA